MYCFNKYNGKSNKGGSELWEGMVGRMGCNFKLSGQDRLKLNKTQLYLLLFFLTSCQT